MLRVYAQDYLRIGARIIALQNVFEKIAHRVELSDPGDAESPPAILFETAPKGMSQEDQKFAKTTLADLEKLSIALNLQVSSALVNEAIKDPPKTPRELDLLALAFSSELKAQTFLFVPPHLAKYYDLTLGDGITTNFPTASKEIVESGNSLAAGLYTACVFHAMRAAEIGMRALGAALAVSFPDKPLELAEWQNILDQADSKIIAMQKLAKGVHKDEELNFYSQAAVQFRYFKDAWRVRVAHARETYEETKATRVFNHTLEFFEILASRLKEHAV
jgi:hypothetical protein